MEILALQFSKRLMSPVDGHISADQNGEGPLLSESTNIHLLIGETSSRYAPPSTATELPAEGLCAVTAGPGEGQRLV